MSTFSGRIPGAVTPPERFLRSEGLRQLLDLARRVSTGGGDVSIYVRSTWRGNVRWARNAIITAGDTTDHEIKVEREIRGASAIATTNQLDETAISNCVRRAETRLRYKSTSIDTLPLRAAEQYDIANLWNDATTALGAEARAEVQRTLVIPAIREKLFAAGYLEVSAIGNGVANSNGLFQYVPQTRAEYSVTVRNGKGTGSGWAGVDNLDWTKIDAERLSAIALQKCKASADPVAIEPGRYTVILEPQAVADLMVPLIYSLNRISAEMGSGPWADRPDITIAPDMVLGSGLDNRVAFGSGGQSKIGKKVLDERVTISYDPVDPEMPTVPFFYDSTPMRAVKWIEGGVLKALSYGRNYALGTLNKSDPLNNIGAFRMAGGTTSLDEMVASTQRGLLVTRLVNVRMLDTDSLLSTGTTSDGLWLIENGRITGPVKNFRFRESPLYAFNNLETLGPAQRVLAWQPAICPAAKVRDFSMTSLADAV